jgi:hypothetical protein
MQQHSRQHRRAWSLTRGAQAWSCFGSGDCSRPSERNTKKRAYIIADNKLALNAGWDDELLGLELIELKETDFDLFEDISATAISSGKMPPRDWACKLQPVRLYPIFDRTRSSALRGHSAVPEPAAGVGAETNGSDRSSGFPPGILLRGVASTVY